MRYLVRQGCNLAYRDEWGSCVYDVRDDSKHDIKREVTMGLRERWLQHLKKTTMYGLSLASSVNEVIVDYLWGCPDQYDDMSDVDFSPALSLTYETPEPTLLTSSEETRQSSLTAESSSGSSQLRPDDSSRRSAIEYTRKPSSPSGRNTPSPPPTNVDRAVAALTNLLGGLDDADDSDEVN